VADGLQRLDGVLSVSRVADELIIAASDGPALVPPVARELAASNLHVESLTVRLPTLDDVFAELTGSRIA
jgi:hypothetical protein